jgi:phospholipase/carboxylesterase
VHGLGDTPANFAHLFDGLSRSARLVIPRAPKAFGRGGSWFDTPIPVPTSGQQLSAGIVQSADRLCRLIGEMETKQPSQRRPVITGYSQGGILSFAVAARCPEKIGLAIPVAGLLPDDITLPANGSSTQRPGIVAIHGNRDDVVPFSDGRRTLTRFKKAGYPATFHTHEGDGHAITANIQHQWHQILEDYLQSGTVPLNAR